MYNNISAVQGKTSHLWSFRSDDILIYFLEFGAEIIGVRELKTLYQCIRRTEFPLSPTPAIKNMEFSDTSWCRKTRAHFMVLTSGDKVPFPGTFKMFIAFATIPCYRIVTSHVNLVNVNCCNVDLEVKMLRDDLLKGNIYVFQCF